MLVVSNPARRLLAPALCLILVIMAFGAALGDTPRADSAAGLVERLRGGGYNLYVRHAATDWSASDNIDAHGDWRSCDPARVRQLSQEGRRAARAVGEALSALGVRLGRVFASPYCRTRETARLIAGRQPEATDDLMNLRSAGYVGGRDAVVARARTLVSRPPADGVNDLFAAHGNLARAALGRYPGEGGIVVIAPRGDGKFEIVGMLAPGALEELAGE